MLVEQTTVAQNVVGIPESITLNGQVFTVKDTPELLSFIQAVSKVEKNKLYSQFEKLKGQISELSSVQLPSSAPLDTEAISKLKSEIVQELSPAIKELRDMVAPVAAATSKSIQDELTAYREKIINNNLGACIPDLVKGNSKEELDQTLAESIRLRAQYPSANSTNPTGKVEDPLIKKQLAEQEEITRNVPVIPAVPKIPASEVTTPNTKGMSMEEFSNRREALLADLNSMFK
jgi:hypothetical protein